MEPEDIRRASSELDAQADGGLPTQDDEREAEVGFEGDSLQTAQDKIMSELARLKDSE